uniref:SIX class homeobox transcription factor SIX32b n=1 Tax=Mnemiopsis leidyi TaxID=27923 RepID=E3UJY7_MNELE|nr:SIX class homeobox transcription factor SIX32b [Mnemiopsis leidyi]
MYNLTRSIEPLNPPPPVLYVPGRKSSNNNLIYNGNRYCLDKRRNDRTYWRCVAKKCYSRVTIRAGKVLKSSPHISHPPTASFRDYIIGETVLEEDLDVGDLALSQEQLQTLYLLPLQSAGSRPQALTTRQQNIPTTLIEPIPTTLPSALPAKSQGELALTEFLLDFELPEKEGDVENMPSVPADCCSFHEVFPQPANISRTQLNYVLKQVVSQTKGNVENLAKFIDSIPPALSGVTEYLLAVKAMVNFKQKNTMEVIRILESTKFREIPWEPLQRLWYAVQYEHEERFKGRKLGAVDKYRVRKKWPLPPSISDESGTCLFGSNRDSFTPKVRRILWDHYHLEKFPDNALKILIAKRSGLTFHQVNNWFKNRRQRDSCLDTRTQSTINVVLSNVGFVRSRSGRAETGTLMSGRYIGSSIDFSETSSRSGSIDFSETSSRAGFRGTVYAKIAEFYMGRCDICYKHMRKSGLQRHKRTVHFKDKRYKCRYCDKWFEPTTKYHHNADADNLSQKFHNCRYCAKTFADSSNRNKHEKNVHLKQKRYKCQFCSKRFCENSTKAAHEKAVHLKQRPYKCRVCDRTFGQSSNRNSHEKRVHGTFRYYSQLADLKGPKGDIFPKETTTITRRENNLQGPQQCDTYRQRRFGGVQELNQSNTVHSSLRQNQCRYCDKTFSQSGHRNTHEKNVHLKQKPHKCGYCDKTFGQASNRNAHERRVHLKLKPHKCRYCDKTFGEIYNRKTHERKIHLKQKPG